MKKEKLIAVLSTAAIITGGSSSSILSNGQETIVEDENAVEKELTKQEKLQQKIDTAKKEAEAKKAELEEQIEASKHLAFTIPRTGWQYRRI